MAKDFGTVKANVGNNVIDTSTEFNTIIGNYVNQRYFDVFRRANFSVYDDDYTITATAGTSKYTLPSDFGKEITVVDTTNETVLNRKEFQQSLEENYLDLLDTGEASDYYIFDTVDASGNRVKNIQFYPIPDGSDIFKVPYQIAPTTLTASGDNFIMNCEDAVELGATSDAWRYKRQFAKAQEYEMLYEKALAALIWDRTNQPNMTYQFDVTPLDRDDGIL